MQKKPYTLHQKQLFVHEALDAHLRGLLERLVHDFHLLELTVGRQCLVCIDPYSLMQISDSLLVESCLLHGISVEIDKSNEFAGPVHDYGLYHIVLIVHHSLNLLRVDILAVCAENHALAAASDEDIAVSVDDAEVACLEEAVLRKCSCVASGFL